MLWRRALVATILIAGISYVLNVGITAVVRPMVEGDNTFLEQMDWTAGSFIYITTLIQRGLNALITFAVIWWTLRMSLPNANYKQKRGIDESLRSRQASDYLADDAHPNPNTAFDKEDQEKQRQASTFR